MSQKFVELHCRNDSRPAMSKFYILPDTATNLSSIYIMNTTMFNLNTVVKSPVIKCCRHCNQSTKTDIENLARKVSYFVPQYKNLQSVPTCYN